MTLSPLELDPRIIHASRADNVWIITALSSLFRAKDIRRLVKYRLCNLTRAVIERASNKKRPHP